VSGPFRDLRGGRLVALLVGLVVAAAVPLVYHDAYYLTVIVTGLIVLTLNISWNFVLGMAGVWNFGQLAIYALGAYGAGLLMLHVSALPAAVDVVLGGAIAAAVAVLVAVPTLRLFGIYTSLLTFASRLARPATFRGVDAEYPWLPVETSPASCNRCESSGMAHSFPLGGTVT